MRKLSPREMLLLVVVAGLAILGWVYSGGGGLGGGGGGSQELTGLDYGDPPVVELARLDLEPVSYNAKARNLFAYYVPPPPPRQAPPPRVQTPPPPRQPPPPRVVQQRPPTPQQPVQPKAPRPNFRYIGHLGPKDNKIAVLEHGDDVLLASIGEPILNMYKVVEFRYETLVIGYTEERFADQTTELPLKR